MEIVIKHSNYCQHNFTSMVFICLIVLTPSIFAQQSSTSLYQFLSPVPNSKMILPETNIIIREGSIIDEATLANNRLTVVGSISGEHQGSSILSDDQRTIIFKPFIVFSRGETVYVYYSGGMKNANGDELLPFNFEFVISKRDAERNYFKSITELPEQNIESEVSLIKQSSNESIFLPDEGLPEDFPTITINTYNNPTDGFLFISPYNINGSFSYLIISDNHGIPIYYKTCFI